MVLTVYPESRLPLHFEKWKCVIVFPVCVFQSPVERAALVEMLNLLMRLKPASNEFVKTLLTLLAFKKLGLR